VDTHSFQYEYGLSPLMAASVNGHIEVIRYLIEKGAHINYKSQGGWTALMGCN
jgi:ankyrin repeat protein